MTPDNGNNNDIGNDLGNAPSTATASANTTTGILAGSNAKPQTAGSNKGPIDLYTKEAVTQIPIAPGRSVYLIERTGAAAGSRTIVHDALVLSLTMDQGYAAPKGQPAIDAICGNDLNKHAGSSQWERALDRHLNVVHSSHPDFLEGRTLFAYEEVGIPSDMDQATRVACEANRVLCALMGDTSFPPYEMTTESYKASLQEGIRTILRDPAISNEELHQQWMERRLAEGWKFGQMRDETTMENPGIAPWSELPNSVRAKDYLFGAVVRAVSGLPVPQLSPDVNLSNDIAPAALVGKDAGELVGAGASA